MNFEYPWDQAPSWANWAATDEDGRAWWYECRPCVDEDSGCSWGPGQYGGLGCRIEEYQEHPEAATRWKESLQQRSEANPLTALRNLTPATLDALSTHDLEDFSRLCNLWNNYSAEILDSRLYK